MKNGKLDGTVAIETGAPKGIGGDIAKRFAAEGAAGVVNYASSKADGELRLIKPGATPNSKGSLGHQ